MINWSINWSHFFTVQTKNLILLIFYILQIKTFKPELVALRNESLIDELKEALADVEHKPEIIPGEQGIIEVEPFFLISYDLACRANIVLPH